MHAKVGQIKVKANSEGLSMGLEGSHSETLLRWMVVCLDERKGGLGLSALNSTLLCRWCWCLLMKREHFENKSSRGNIEKKGVALSCNAGGVWCWVIKSHKEGLGPFK